jgi:hypothetical protein
MFAVSEADAAVIRAADTWTTMTPAEIAEMREGLDPTVVSPAAKLLPAPVLGLIQPRRG